MTGRCVIHVHTCIPTYINNEAYRLSRAAVPLLHNGALTVFRAVLANTSSLLHALIALERAAFPASHDHHSRAVRFWGNDIFELRTCQPPDILAGMDIPTPPLGLGGCLGDMDAEHGARHSG